MHPKNRSIIPLKFPKNHLFCKEVLQDVFSSLVPVHWIVCSYIELHLGSQQPGWCQVVCVLWGPLLDI